MSTICASAKTPINSGSVADWGNQESMIASTSFKSRGSIPCTKQSSTTNSGKIAEDDIGERRCGDSGKVGKGPSIYRVVRTRLRNVQMSGKL